MALFGLVVVLVSPFRAWLVDRHGPRRALPPMAAAFAAVLVVIALIPPRSGVNDTAVAVLAAAAGASAPPLGVVMRTLWSTLVSDRDALQAACILDGVAEELLYVTGPVITGVITVAATPADGSVTAGLTVAGTGVFLRSPACAAGQPRGEGAVRSRRPRDRGGGHGPALIAALAFAAGATGLCLGGLGLVIVAFAQARHDPAGRWPGSRRRCRRAAHSAGVGYGAVTGGFRTAAGSPAGRRPGGHPDPAALSPNLLAWPCSRAWPGRWFRRPWRPPTSSPRPGRRQRHGTVPGTGSTAATTRGPRPGRRCPGRWPGGSP